MAAIAPEGCSYWSVLKDKAGMALQDGMLGVGEQALSCTVREVGKEPPDVAMELPNGGMLLQSAVYRQLIQKLPLDARLTPESVSPSTLKGDAEVELSGVRQEKIAPAFDLDLEVSGAVRGDLLHRALEVLAGESARAALVTEATGYPFTTDQIDAITETMNGFESWVNTALGASDVGREVPLLALNENGSVVSGAIDVLARTGEGYWIIDYKSDATDDYEAHFRMYQPQLLAYAKALRQTGSVQPVCGIAIFWIITGEVFVMPLQE
jgi:ATP-dependent helicase/nuclease subunit A